MPKGVPNKRYTPEFKRMVVETMEKEHLSNGFPRCHHIRLLGCNGKLPSAHHHPGGVLLHVPVHHDDHHSGRSHAGQAEKSEGSQKETGSGSPAAGRGGMSMPENTPLNKQD